MITSDADAPALTPSSPGSPSGLRVRPWITTPATASAAPTSSPSCVRGIREATTVEANESSGVRHADHTSPSGTGLAPTAMLRPTTRTSRSTAATSPSPSTSAREPRTRVACGARATAVLIGWHGTEGQACAFSAPAVMSGTYSSSAHGTLSGVATETAMPSFVSSIGT